MCLGRKGINLKKDTLYIIYKWKARPDMGLNERGGGRGVKKIKGAKIELQIGDETPRATPRKILILKQKTPLRSVKPKQNKSSEP